ncbi:Bcr/CflA family drug resistance efflux transporter [Terasakiella brassicae]|uniref:Bcr/CflA family efflux transporter n=1 Tax=Terasakiella brassicae TaxID=1634917 RepID=A0A917C1H0_9PROT|nr:multidrug effflux MFS transporter [Terasakiella brassicae]GGF67275.1 Bcr/CflA family drug resistance efflux transporter [Terasakiella brassicae]
MKTHNQHTGEFIALMAFLMSLVALAIDAILPAFHAVGASYDIIDENRLQLLVGVLFLGMAIGQLFYGPLSDSIGRKPATYIGLILFIVGALVSAFAPTYEIVLWGRFLQGFGVAGPRTISIALVRDQYSGREMARIMSFVISIFIIMPAIAPALGAGILVFGTWHAIFFLFALLAFVALVWLILRQPETHPQEKRTAFSLVTILQGARFTLGNRYSCGYMIVGGLAFSCLVAYLNTAKLLYADIFQIDELFPLYFGMLALFVGAASIVNGKMVVKYGMRSMMKFALIAMILSSGSFFFYLYFTSGHPSFVLFMVSMASIFFFMGILFGNANAMAMEPVGHIAGIASSIIGAGTTFVSMSLGALVGQFYDQTLLPLIGGYFALALSAYVIMSMIERKDMAV